MTGTCGEPLVFCELPEGHENNIHHAEWPMPKETAEKVHAAIDDYEKRARMYRIAMWYFIGAAVINVFGIIGNLIGAA